MADATEQKAPEQKPAEPPKPALKKFSVKYWRQPHNGYGQIFTDAIEAVDAKAAEAAIRDRYKNFIVKDVVVAAL
jgi:hypothetical protein